MARSTKIFGQKLKQAREKVHLTQAGLGEKLDPKMSDENIGRIERSEVAGVLTKHVPHLAAALGITVEAFKRTIVAPASAVSSSGFQNLKLPAPLVERIRAAAVRERLTIERLLEEMLEDVEETASTPRLAAAPKNAESLHESRGKK